MNIDDYIVPDPPGTEPDLGATCENGCPEGAQGRHKFSCYWAGRWFYEGQAATILGESPDQQTVCIESNGEHFHAARHAALSLRALSRTRYPDMKVKLTGTDGNVFTLMGKVQDALRRNGHLISVEEFARDVMSAESYDDALQRIQMWVSVS